MKTTFWKRLTAAAVSGALLLGAIPASGAAVVSAEDANLSTTPVYVNDFESGDVSAFHKRGDDTDTTTMTVDSSDAYSGSSCMLVSGRQKSWHGPAITLDDLCTPGEQYLVSLAVKTPWYATVTLSMQSNNASGEATYSNLTSQISQGDWVTFENVKIAMPDNGGVSVYLECSDANVDFYVDDFSITTAPVYAIQEDIVSLKDAYAPYFKVGTAVTTDELAPASTKNLILKHFNSVTLGNELKPDAILDKNACLEMAADGDDTNPQVNIASARSILNFCRDNDISVRGHVLVWHSQTPDWFFRENYDENGDWVTKDVMLQRMENYIKNVFEAVTTEYPTVDFYAWDVVNECWLDDGSYRTGGTQAENANYSGWVKVFGDNSFIEPAFEYARKYAPEGCKLYYNDFNEYMPGKLDAIYNMAMDLKEKDLIDGIGMQSHLDVDFPTASTYKKALDKYASTGLDVQITELDITTSDTSEAGFEKQAQLYSDILDACVEYADSVSAVVFWGTTDDKSWRSSRYPLLFNEDYTAKPAYYAIVDDLPDVPVVTTATTEKTTETTTETETETDIEELTTEPTNTVLAEPGGFLELTQLPDKTIYQIGEALDLTGLGVTLKYYPGGEIPESEVNNYKIIFDNVAPQEYRDDFVVDTTEFDSTKAGTYTIRVSLTEDTAHMYWVLYDDGLTFEVTVAEEGEIIETTTSETTTSETTTEESSDSTETTIILTTTASTATSDSGTLPPGEILYGDLNLDGKIDLTDAIMLNKVCAGVIVDISDGARANADCDANGDIDTNDAIVLLRFLVHLIDALPSAE